MAVHNIQGQSAVNEKFKELMKQADMGYLLYKDGMLPGNVNPDSLKKFAELIVRECVRYFNEDYQRDFDTLWREDLTKGIKEHFGIEE